MRSTAQISFNRELIICTQSVYIFLTSSGKFNINSPHQPECFPALRRKAGRLFVAPQPVRFSPYSFGALVVFLPRAVWEAGRLAGSLTRSVNLHSLLQYLCIWAELWGEYKYSLTFTNTRVLQFCSPVF